MKEKDILRIVRAHGFIATRINAGKIKSGRRWIQLAEPGWSDTFGFHRVTGQLLALELKREDKLSEKQREFLDSVEKAGGIASVVRTEEDVEDAEAGVESAISAGMRVLGVGNAAKSMLVNWKAGDLSQITVLEILTVG